MTSPSLPSYPETCRAGHPWATSAYIKPNGDRFCKVCYNLRRHERYGLTMKNPDVRLSPAERLMKRLDRTPGHGPKGECWIYVMCTNEHGYGVIGKDGGNVLAHRLAYEIAHGPIPEGKIVCHHCDWPPCCRPDHLFAGTHDDNSKDKMAKGRGPDMKAVSLYRRNPAGERNGMAKFTWEQVRGIRAEYAKGGISQSALAKKHNTNSGNICMIINRKSWKEASIEPVSAN